MTDTPVVKSELELTVLLLKRSERSGHEEIFPVFRSANGLGYEVYIPVRVDRAVYYKDVIYPSHGEETSELRVGDKVNFKSIPLVKNCDQNPTMMGDIGNKVLAIERIGAGTYDKTRTALINHYVCQIYDDKLGNMKSRIAGNGSQSDRTSDESTLAILLGSLFVREFIMLKSKYAMTEEMKRDMGNPFNDGQIYAALQKQCKDEALQIVSQETRYAVNKIKSIVEHIAEKLLN